MLRDAVGWLNTVRKASLSDAVIYQRGGLQLTGLLATPAQTDNLIDAALGVRIESDQQDWIISAADLVLAGKVTKPSRGDVIIAAGTYYEVQSPDGSAQPFNIDSTGLQMRIHCKRIK